MARERMGTVGTLSCAAAGEALAKQSRANRVHLEMSIYPVGVCLTNPRISCKRGCPCPHKLTFHSVRKEPRAHWEVGTSGSLSAACAG